MSFFLRAPCLQSIKQTTGIVGLEVIPNSRDVLRGLVQRVLSDVRAHIPEEAGYRKVVEATYASRLDVIDAKTGALLWRGSTEGRLRDLRTPEERTARVNEVVAAVIAKFPPGEDG